MIRDSLSGVAKLIPKNSTVIVHARVKNLYGQSCSHSQNSLKLLDDIRQTLSPSEIFVPTFTYSFTKTKIFNVRETPAEVGRFSEEIRKHFAPMLIRTVDPIFSIIETEGKYNNNSEIIVSFFGENSVWRYLDNKAHFILNINLNSPIVSTQLHYLEYTQGVPYRYLKKFDGEVTDWWSERCNLSYQYHVRSLSKNPQWNRGKISQCASEKGALIKCGIVRVFDWVRLKKALNKKLLINKNYLIE